MPTLYTSLTKSSSCTMAPSIPQGLLVGSKREHPFHLSGIHTQQSLTDWHFIPWPIWSPSTGNTSTSPLLWRASSYPQFSFQSSTLLWRASSYPQSLFQSSTLLWRASSYPQSTFQSSTGHTQRHKSSSTSELREQQLQHNTTTTQQPCGSYL